MTMSSNDLNMHEGNITTFTKVVIYLRICHALFVKADKEIQTVRRDSLTLWDFSQKLLDLTLQCCVVYNEQTLRGFFVKCINLSICSTKRHWLVDNREAALEDREDEV